MSLAIVIGALLQATAPQATSSPDPVPLDAIFLYGRARYFSALVNLRDCGKRLPQQTKILSSRFDADRRALAERFGARYFDMPPIDPKTVDAKQACDTATLASFEDKLAAVEQLLDGGK